MENWAAEADCSSVRALIGEIRDRFHAAHDIYLRFHDVIVRVSTNEPRLADVLKEYFGPFSYGPSPYDILVTAHEAPPPDLPLTLTLKNPDPGKTKFKEEFADIQGGRVVKKRLTGMVFAFGRDVHAAVGPCMGNPNQVVNFINNRFISHMLDGGYLLGHAAAVMHGGRGLALAGFSGAGKSTLALHLMSRGATFVSNDRLMVKKEAGGLVMYGVAKLPRTNPGTLLSNPHLRDIMAPEDIERFSALEGDALWDLEHKYDVPIEDRFGAGKFELGGRMDGLVVLAWKRDGGKASWRQVPFGERPPLVEAFVKSEGLFYLPETVESRDNSMDAYQELLRDCPLIAFSGGVDFQMAADVCMEFLEKGGAQG